MCRRKEGFGDAGYGFAYRRQKIDASYNYLVANEPSQYLRNTDGENNYELRLEDDSGLNIYKNDVSFIAIDTAHKYPVKDTQQRALVYDAKQKIIQSGMDKRYVYADCIQVKGSTTDLKPYKVRDYGNAYYFKNSTTVLDVSNSDLYLTSDGNLVATGFPMTWANGKTVLTGPTHDIDNGQFIGNADTYYEYIRRDYTYVFEKYKLQQSPWELIKTATYDIPSNSVFYSIPDNTFSTNGAYTLGVSNGTIYIADGSTWKWANGYDVSGALVVGDTLNVDGWMVSSATKLQLRNDGLYLNGSPHVKFNSAFAKKMYIKTGNLIVEDNRGTIIWNLDTGPGNATKLSVDSNTLYLQNANTIKWTIYPDASYNTTDSNANEYTEKVDVLKGIQTIHSGSDERYANVVSAYYREMINTFNLGVGILVGAIVIFRST